MPPGVSLQAASCAAHLGRRAQPLPHGLPEKIKTSIEHELALINDLKFAPYFLTVNDIVTYARSLGILCQRARVCRQLCRLLLSRHHSRQPNRGHLLFERFISEARREPPDIDEPF